MSEWKENQWKEIKSAPRNKAILLKCSNYGDATKGKHYAVAKFDDDQGVFVDAAFDPEGDDIDFGEWDGVYHFATHWKHIED